VVNKRDYDDLKAKADRLAEALEPYAKIFYGMKKVVGENEAGKALIEYRGESKEGEA